MNIFHYLTAVCFWVALVKGHDNPVIATVFGVAMMVMIYKAATYKDEP